MPALRTNTKKFEVLKFIGGHPGVKSKDVEKFIAVELQGKTWDPKKRAGGWSLSLYGSYKNPGIYSSYCTKVDGRWYLTPTTVEIIRRYWVDVGIKNPQVFGYAGGVPLAAGKYRTDQIAADGGGILTMPQLPEPKIIREPVYIPVPLKNETMAEYFSKELDALSIEDLELEAIKVLRETRAALKAKTEEFNRVSKELLDAKSAEKEAANVLRQALGL